MGQEIKRLHYPCLCKCIFQLAVIHGYLFLSKCHSRLAPLPQERARRFMNPSRDPALIQPVAIVLLSSLVTLPRWM